KHACASARGLAVEPVSGAVVVGCAEGFVKTPTPTEPVTLALIDDGIDGIDYDAALARLYIPTSRYGVADVLDLATDGTDLTLAEVATFDASVGVPCVTIDDQDRAWICAPNRGELLRFDAP